MLETIRAGGVYCVAEMSANHAGSLENALAIVRAAKDAGADCVKIQTYTADTLTIDCDNEYFRIKGGLWDGRTLYGLYKEAFTPWEWHADIKRECEKLGLDFLSTPFDASAVDFLEDLGVGFYKIASFELVDIPLISYAASKHKPMVISCGMGSAEEIHDAVRACWERGNRDIVLLKCCSEYPARDGDMNLAAIPDMRRRFDVPVGLSDHTMGSLAPVMAVSLGAVLIEKHFCLDRRIPSADAAFSTEPAEFAAMVRDVRRASAMLGQASYELTDAERASTVFRKSVFAVRDIKRGEALTEANIRVIRPGYGLPPKEYPALLGRSAKRDIAFGTPLERQMLANAPGGPERLRLRAATWQDVDLLFGWANDPETRAQSLHPGAIGYEEHRCWLRGKLDSGASSIYILCDGASPVGQIRADAGGGAAVISYSVAAEFRGVGYGSALVRLLEQELASRPDIAALKAAVRLGNAASIRIFEKAGFARRDLEDRIEFEKPVQPGPPPCR